MSRNGESVFLWRVEGRVRKPCKVSRILEDSGQTRGKTGTVADPWRNLCFFLQPRSIVDRDSENKGNIKHSNQAWDKTETVADQGVVGTSSIPIRHETRQGSSLSWEPKIHHDNLPMAFPLRYRSTRLAICNHRREAAAEIKTRWKTKAVLAEVGESYPRRQDVAGYEWENQRRTANAAFQNFSKPYLHPLNPPLYLPIAGTKVCVNG